MTNQPISPPQKLVEQWRNQAPEGMGSQIREMWIATQAVQYGADQELDACCKVICNSATNFSAAALLEAERGSGNLRTARRPKPPSLKEQGLGALKLLKQRTTDPNIIEPLTRALEALPND